MAVAQAQHEMADIVKREGVKVSYAIHPVARTDPSWPIYGMPILDVERARIVLFGDANEMCEDIEGARLRRFPMGVPVAIGPPRTA